MGLFDGVAVEGRRPVFKLPGSLLLSGILRFPQRWIEQAFPCGGLLFLRPEGAIIASVASSRSVATVFSLPAFEVLASLRAMVFGSTFLGRTRRAEASCRGQRLSRHASSLVLVFDQVKPYDEVRSSRLALCLGRSKPMHSE